MDQKKLQKFADNLLTDRYELEEVINWIEANEKNRAEYNRIKNTWSYLAFRNFDTILQQRNIKESIRRFILHPFLKYAAIILLAFLAGGASVFMFWSNAPFYASDYNEVVVPDGETAEVILSDRTHVWLNSGSSLKYPSAFENKIRRVELSGEAYFKVEKNEQKPFVVATSHLNVKVLGTSFNVEAFDASKAINVTLVDGKVNIENKGGDVLAELNPNEKAAFDRSSNVLRVEKKVDTKMLTSWKEGIIYFEDQRLDEITKRLEHWFNLKIVFLDTSLKEVRYTGAILKNKPIDQIFEILKYTTDIDYSMEIKDTEPSVVYIK
ncbi:FecR family protein [Anaerophaga thermohalophila]|jgi:ferric-dicitrate binding protein FerR (iron transport regulator)|uniref:FecR family protein n=1 Tax=Anaerophaga thermohalophila TaxID=177400 RepID=UPI0002F4D70A|nr:FecR domain-containing protein [Anaerophaga thermohalophila]